MARWGPDDELLPEPPGLLREGPVPTRHEVIAMLREWKPEIRRRLHASGMLLFGSYAREEQTETSDLDVALVADPSLPPCSLHEEVDLADELGTAIGIRVDLSWHSSLRSHVRERADKEGIWI